MNEKPTITPDATGYIGSYTSWAMLKKFRKDLNHQEEHGPKPETFGISEFEAKFIRARVDRDMARTA